MSSNSTRIEVLEKFSNRLWRLNNLYTIVTDEGKAVPFRMNAAQERFYEELWYLNLILKSRQHGFTTFVDILGLDQALFCDNQRVGIIAQTMPDVTEIFDRKVHFPYKHLPEGLKTARPADTANSKKLAFPNGSSVEVAYSLRSGTCQFVHISEFGKICARFPERAREIVSGTLETVHPGSFVFIESTAEGSEGPFYEMSESARKWQQEGRALHQLAYKFHFYAWHEDKRHRLPEGSEVITKELAQYFAELARSHGVVLDREQQEWYAAKARTLKDLIYREHPSTPEEAFKAAVDGAYLAKQMAALRKGGQVARVPYLPTLPVNTAWDIGVNDEMWIVFHQRQGLVNRIFDCMYGTGEGIEYYWAEIQKRGYLVGQNFFPHDAGHKQPKDGQTLVQQISEFIPNVVVVPRTPDKMAAINETRSFLPSCYIDEEKCTPLLRCLDNFRREWDEPMGCFKEKPLHNWACLAGNTKIRTLNGWRTIESLVGEDFYVWAYSLDQHRLVPAKADGCWKSKTTSDLVKVTLDDGAEITCTPDHRFLTRDERWVMAGNLSPGDSLMPMYERTEKSTQYLLIHLNDGTRAVEHSYSFATFNGFLKQGYIIHHKDGNKQNNDPRNLEQLTISEHISHHAREPDRLEKLKKNGNKKAHARASEVLTEVNKARSGDNHHTRQADYWTEERKTKYADGTRKGFKASEVVKDCPQCGEKFLGNYKRVYCCCRCVATARRRRLGKAESLYRPASAHAEDCTLLKENHKVLSVEKVNATMDVYDISVPGVKSFVAEGVVVHNSHGYDSAETLARGVGLGPLLAERRANHVARAGGGRSPRRSWKTA